MEVKEIDVGIFRIKFTVYKTGNVHMSFVNRLSGEETSLKIRNPLVVQKKASSVSYRI